MQIVCYVSGHGFGHAARVCAVVREVRRLRPDARILIRSPLARWFFEFNLGGGVEHGHCELDVGTVQADSLSIDLAATQRAYAAIDAAAPRLVDAEIAAIGERRPRVVLADIPALAFDVAERLGVPGIAMTNFSWDWIYADYVGEMPSFAPLVASLRRSYARASLLLRLPLHGELSAFPRRRDIPFVARRAALSRDDVRTRLALRRGDRLVLISFGGLGLQLERAPTIPGVTFLSTVGGGQGPAGGRAFSHAQMTAAGVRYEDLVGACDAVMTKPGYGIVAECIANATPIVYTARGRFAEYPCLVAGIEAHVPNAFISNDDLRAGRWGAALESVFAQPRREPSVRIDGATVAAQQLV